MLAAVTEVIKTEGGSETETEYFAALVGSASPGSLVTWLYATKISPSTQAILKLIPLPG